MQILPMHADTPRAEDLATNARPQHKNIAFQTMRMTRCTRVGMLLPATTSLLFSIILIKFVKKFAPNLANTLRQHCAQQPKTEERTKILMKCFIRWVLLNYGNALFETKQPRSKHELPQLRSTSKEFPSELLYAVDSPLSHFIVHFSIPCRRP